MALIALASARSPGLTTATLALAAAWPEARRAMVAELDPDGGTTAASRATSPDPGLNTLAAAGRHYLWVNMVASHLQQASDGTVVLLAPPSPDRTVAALETLNRVDLPAVLRELPELDVLADCGRIDSRSPALPVLRAADAVLFVVRSAANDVIALQHRLQTLDLSSRQAKAGIVAVSEGPYGIDELTAALPLPVVGVIEWDPKAAAALGEGRRPNTSSRLLRSAGRLAAAIASQVPAPNAEPALSPSDAGIDRAAGVPSPTWTPSYMTAGQEPPSAPRRRSAS